MTREGSTILHMQTPDMGEFFPNTGFSFRWIGKECLKTRPKLGFA